MKTNTKPKFTETTNEGAPAKRITSEQELRRSVMSCLLWEDTFYEDGKSIADRIKETIPLVEPSTVASIAIEAREKMHLRHVPLLIVREMARLPKHKAFVSDTLARVIQRPDELAEFMSIYWLDGKQPISAQVKSGLALAFHKFNAYQLAKYNRDEAIKLRDVLFLCHAKPKDEEQAKTWKQLVDGTLPIPDTWEVALSAGKDKKETWERLISENKLGGLAFIRNLRNMEQAGVSFDAIKNYTKTVKTDNVLPFRFIAAAKAAPKYEEQMDYLLLKSIQEKKISGKTVVVIDVSGSMYGSPVSSKSDMDRALAACSLGAIAREVFEDVSVYATAGNDGTRQHKTELVPNRHGMALVDAIYGLCRPLGGGGIFLTPVCRWLEEREKDVERMIVITDEQDCAIDGKDSPNIAKPFGKHNYLINVSTNKNGIGYGAWTHIDGWSESVIDYIIESEKNQ